MKKLFFLAAFLLACSTVRAQQPVVRIQTFTATGSGTVIPLSGTNVKQNQIQWWGFGTLATCTVKLEQSATGTGSWSDLIAGASCTSNAASTLTAGTPNFVRITVTALSGGGNIVVGYTGALSSSSGSTVDIGNVPHVICDSGCSGTTLGQALMAASLPVAIASDQSAVPISGTVTVTDGAGSLNTIVDSGHIIIDGGSTTAVTGNVATTAADGSNVTLGAKADAKSTATDTTAVTAMQVLKEISAMEQAPASRAVTNAGTFATQSAITAASGSIASGAIASGALASGSVTDGAVVTLGTKADAKSTATDTTAVSGISILKEISAMEQAPASRAVTNAGTFAVQDSTVDGAITSSVMQGNVKQINGITPLMGNGTTGTGSQRVTIASDNTAFAVNATLAAETTKVIGTARIIGNAGAVLDAATGAAPPANAMLSAGLGSGATGGDMIGMPVGDTYKNINISSATTTLLVTGVSGRQVRISAMHFVTAAANNVALIEGTGATCGTGSAGMAGGTTAASGYNLAANGGIAFGTGVGTIMQTATTGDSVCAVTSAGTQLSGGLQYAIY